MESEKKEKSMDIITRNKIIQFVITHKKLDDDDFHAFVESLGVDPHEAEEEIYAILNRKVPFKSTPSLEDIAKKHKVSLESIEKEFGMGKKVELEHTKESAIAEQIAKHHLDEFPNYYTKLKIMEDSMKGSASDIQKSITLSNQQRENNIIKGFYLDTPENRKKGRVGLGYDADAGVTLSDKELQEKSKSTAKKPEGVKFTVKTGDTVHFEKDGKRFVGRVTRYPSNDKIEINYGSVIISKEEIVGAQGKLFEGVGEKDTEVHELAPLGQDAGSDSERALRASEKVKLSKEIESFKAILRERALKNISSSIAELETYQNKLKRWKQLGGGSTSLYGFVSKKEVPTDVPVENPEEADKERRFVPRKLISLVDKVKDILAENFDVDTVTAYRNDFMKSSLYKKAIGGGTKIDEAKLIDAFEQYTSSFFSPRGITSMF